MSTERALLAAVAAAPADDLPRLVYADWLDENGRPDRAEFIRLQCEVARVEPDWSTSPLEWDHPEAYARWQRARELLDRHGREWFPLLDRSGFEVVTSRGFPIHFAGPARQFVAHAGDVFRAHPTIEDVLLEKLGRNTPALAACPALGRVRGLEFYFTPFRAREAGQLAASPHLGNLRAFKISNTETQIGPDGLRALTRAPTLTGLEHLDVYGNGVYDDGARALTAADRLATLRRLDLGNNGLTDEAARDLAAARHLTLTELGLMSNHLGPDGAAALVGAAHLASLESLNLSGNRIGAAGVRAVAGSKHLGRLTELLLRDGGVADADLVPLFATRNLPALTSLGLGEGDRVGVEAIQALAANPGFPRLESLYWGNVGLDGRAAAALGKVATLPGLRTVHLDDNPIGPDGARRLAAGPLLAQVTYLELDNCKLGGDGVEALVGSKNLRSVRFLGLMSNQLDDRSARLLAETPHLPALRCVSVNGNRLGKAAKQALVRRFGPDGVWGVD